MIEKHIILEDIDPALIYGVNNANLQMIKALFPKLRIMARGNVIRAMGDDEVLETFENYIKQLEEHGARYNSLKEEVLLDIFNGNRPMVEREGDVIVFSITGRGTVATGRVERGVVKVSDTVELVGLTEKSRSTVVTGVEMFRKLLDQAEAGDNVGALLRGINRTDIKRGQVLAKPGSIHPHTKFKGQVYVLTEKEGGRSKPFFSGYRPQFYFRTTDVTGVITLPADVEMCRPGDNVDMNVELITPIACEKGLRFAIREGGRTVGSGVVGEIFA